MKVIHCPKLNRPLSLIALLSLVLSTSGCWTKLKQPGGASTAGGGSGSSAKAPTTPTNSPNQANKTAPAANSPKANPGRVIPTPTPTTLAQAQAACATVSVTVNPAPSGVSLSPIPTLAVASAQGMIPYFNALSPGQQALLFHLSNIGELSRTLRYGQSHHLAPELRQVLGNSLNDQNSATLAKILTDSAALAEWRSYGALFYQNTGPYNAKGVKSVLSKVKQADACTLITLFAQRNGAPLPANLRTDIMSLLFDPATTPLRRPQTAAGFDQLALSGGNLYSPKVKGSDVQTMIAASPAKLTPEANCRVVADPKTGALECRYLNAKDPGESGKVLTQIVTELQAMLALTNADKTSVLTDPQKTEVTSTIAFIQDTDQAKFDTDRQAALTAWESVADAPLDFLLGFLNTRADFLGHMATWETQVGYADPTVALQAQALAAGTPKLTANLGFDPSWVPATLPAFPALEVSLQSESDRSTGIYDYETPKMVVLLPAINVANPSNRERAGTIFKILRETVARSATATDPSKYPAGATPTTVFGTSLEKLRLDVTALALASDPSLTGGTPSATNAGFYKDAEDATTVQHELYNDYLIAAAQKIANAPSASDPTVTDAWLLIAQLINAKVITLGGAPADPTQPSSPFTLDYTLLPQALAKFATTLQRIKFEADVTSWKALQTDAQPLLAQTEALIATIFPSTAAAGAGSTASVQQVWRVRQNGTSYSLVTCGDKLENFFGGCPQ